MRSQTTPSATDAPDSALETRWMFVLLCVYIASQGYTAALLPVGPWPLWPGLPDVALGMLVVAWIGSTRQPPLTGIRRTAFRVMAGLTLVACVSYVVLTLLVANINSVTFGHDQQGPSFGLFEVVRLLQFLLLFWIALHIPFTPHRITVLRRVVTGTLVFVLATVLLTFRNTISPGVFSPLLPREWEAAGAWWHFVHNHDGYGLGAISYTHAYVAAQITLLLGLALHMRGRERSIGSAVLVVLAVSAALVTGSRAGFAGILLVAMGFFIARSPRWLLNAALGVALLVTAITLYYSSIPVSGGSGNEITAIVEHQVNAFRPFESDNLVGREEIWSGRLDYMNQHPWRWIVGWGLGSSPDTGPGLSPHMLPLQIAMELGIGMLLIVVIICAAMLRDIWHREGGEHGFFWATIALFVSSTTQETFYPVPSTGYFLGFYLVALAIVMRPQTDPVAAPANEWFGETAPRPGYAGMMRDSAI